MKSVEKQTTFQRTILSPASSSKVKPSKNLAINKTKQNLPSGLLSAAQCLMLDSKQASYLPYISLFLGLFFHPEDGGDI
jgi:hypothetical protein